MASVAFVKFTGVDDLLAEHGPDATADALHEVVTAVQQAAEEEAVTFLASDIDENGGKIILTAGVPVARDDDEGRVLRAPRARSSTQPLALPVRIGVNRGHVFAGDIGTEFRAHVHRDGRHREPRGPADGRRAPRRGLRHRRRARPRPHAVRDRRARAVLREGQVAARAGVRR